MDSSNSVGTAPIAVELEEGKAYAWCACGKSGTGFCNGAHKGTGIGPKMFNASKSGVSYICACGKSKNGPYCDGSHKA